MSFAEARTAMPPKKKLKGEDGEAVEQDTEIGSAQLAATPKSSGQACATGNLESFVRPSR